MGDGSPAKAAGWYEFSWHFLRKIADILANMPTILAIFLFLEQINSTKVVGCVYIAA
jgi:hypothetical protein